jgi:hypothetical protein
MAHRLDRRPDGGRARTALTVIFMLFAVTASAQMNPFAGTWQGTIVQNGMSVTINLVMGPDQAYSQQVRAGTLMTLERGFYAVSGQTITFQVVDWEPKTQPVYHPTPGGGGYYTHEPTAKPPGGTFRFDFASATSVRLQDVNFGGVIVLSRIQ